MTRRKYLNKRCKTRQLKSVNKQAYLYSLLNDIIIRTGDLLNDESEYCLNQPRRKLYYWLEELDHKCSLALMRDVIQNGIAIKGNNHIKITINKVNEWLSDMRYHNGTLYICKLNPLQQYYDEQNMFCYISNWHDEPINSCIITKWGTLQPSLLSGYIRVLIESGKIPTINSNELELWLLPAKMQGMNLTASS